jgi:hypothetical protein
MVEDSYIDHTNTIYIILLPFTHFRSNKTEKVLINNDNN